MVFDMGFNFRATSGYVTDPAYGVPVLNEVYPTTYTNANGDSINAGWDASVAQSADRSASNDPRIAGINYRNNSLNTAFQVDLSSGSAPGAGTYTVDFAIGDQGGSHPESFKLFDTSTLLIDGTNGGAGYTTAANHYIDATLADVTATTTWTGTTVSKTFATTMAKLFAGVDILGDVTCVAHFRLTLTGGGQSVVPVLMAQYRQRRN